MTLLVRNGWAGLSEHGPWAFSWVSHALRHGPPHVWEACYFLCSSRPPDYWRDYWQERPPRARELGLDCLEFLI